MPGLAQVWNCHWASSIKILNNFEQCMSEYQAGMITKHCYHDPQVVHKFTVLCCIVTTEMLTFCLLAIACLIQSSSMASWAFSLVRLSLSCGKSERVGSGNSSHLPTATSVSTRGVPDLNWGSDAEGLAQGDRGRLGCSLAAELVEGNRKALICGSSVLWRGPQVSWTSGKIESDIPSKNSGDPGCKDPGCKDSGCKLLASLVAPIWVLPISIDGITVWISVSLSEGSKLRMLGDWQGLLSLELLEPSPSPPSPHCPEVSTLSFWSWNTGKQSAFFLGQWMTWFVRGRQLSVSISCTVLSYSSLTQWRSCLRIAWPKRTAWECRKVCALWRPSDSRIRYLFPQPKETYLQFIIHFCNSHSPFTQVGCALNRSLSAAMAECSELRELAPPCDLPEVVRLDQPQDTNRKYECE